MLVSSIGDVVFGEVVDEGKRAVVDGFVDHAHVVSVKNAMHEPVDLPVGNELGGFFNDDFVHLFVGIALVLGNARVAVF